MTRHLISVTLSPAAYEVTRTWAELRDVSRLTSAAIVHYDMNGPRSKSFVKQQREVADRERSIAFLGTVIRDLNIEIDALKAAATDD